MKRIIQIAILATFWVAQCPANVVSHDRQGNTVKVDQYGADYKDKIRRPQPKSPHRQHTKKDLEQIITGR